MNARLGGLHLYPVKSAAGIACESAILEPYGLRHDREWMIVDLFGRGITQRDDARLALLRTALDDTHLRLANPEGAGPAVALRHEGERREVQVWGAKCLAFDAGDEVATFLADWLGRPLRLVRFDESRTRYSNPDWTAGRDVPTLFTDGFPLLVLARNSVGDLAARVGRALPIERFRPNLVLDDIEAYGEDRATNMRIGAVHCVLTKACVRCVITTIDHERGERTDEEPLRTLKTYRFDAALRGVVFGRNAYVTTGAGAILHRGTAVELGSP
jgi:uncharacterized protein YcbX